jgi:hypothetical protein
MRRSAKHATLPAGAYAGPLVVNTPSEKLVSARALDAEG